MSGGVRIICEDCLRRVDVHWQSESSNDFWYGGNRRVLAHVECHGEHRLVALPHVVTMHRGMNSESYAVTAAMTRDPDPGERVGTVTWGSLEDYLQGDGLQKRVEELELEATRLLERAKVFERVLRGIAPAPGDVKIMPEKRLVEPEPAPRCSSECTGGRCCEDKHSDWGGKH